MAVTELAADLRRKVIEKIGVPVRDGRARAGEINTAYLEAGQGPALLLAHGAMSNGLCWYPVIERLAQSFRVIAPDLPGHGASDKPAVTYDREFYSGWLARFLAALGLEKINLVGNSLGGAIALEFALNYPEKVSRLALVNAVALGRMPLLGAPGYTMNVLRAEMFPRRLNEERAQKLWQGLVYNPASMDETAQIFGRYCVEALKEPNATRPFWRGQTQVVQPFPPARLGQLKAPPLLLWGAADRIAPLNQGQAAAQVIPGARLVTLEQAGHAPFFDQPEAFCRELTAFLAA